MNERTRGMLVVAICIAAVVLGYKFFLQPYFAQERAVIKVLSERSTWNVTLQEYVINGAISAETFRVANDDGKVKMFYSATSRSGLITKQFDVQLFGPNATFLYEELRADGIWELEDRPLLPHPRDEYIAFVSQTLGNEGGSRAFGFSDPQYWAASNAREFSLHPQATGSGPPMTTVSGRSLREPRYLKIVQLIKNFGPASVQQAEAKIRAELIEADSGLRPPRASTP